MAENSMQPGPSECRHCGWLCAPNNEPKRAWYPLEQPTEVRAVEQQPAEELQIRSWIDTAIEALTDGGIANKATAMRALRKAQSALATPAQATQGRVSSLFPPLRKLFDRYSRSQITWGEFVGLVESELVALAAAQATQGGAEPVEFHCNKCGYVGPDQYPHARPNVPTRQCNYMASPIKSPQSTAAAVEPAQAAPQAAAVPKPAKTTLAWNPDFLTPVEAYEQGRFDEQAAHGPVPYPADGEASQAAVVPEAVERDVARYQWLRDYYSPPGCGDDWDAMDRAMAIGAEQLDVAVDAAIDRLAAKPTGKEQSS